MMQQPTSIHHHFRFYIVMITLVIGGIFFLLLMNNNSENNGKFSFTSAIIGNINNISASELETDTSKSKTRTKSSTKGINEVEMSMAFDRIVHFTASAKVDEIIVRSTDLTTSITVNDDQLELTNLEIVSLNIEDFAGNLDVKEEGITLAGQATRIAVNGIALSSQKEIEITFEDLEYNYLRIEDIELDDLRFEQGNGELEIANKLQYTIEEENVFIQRFSGTFTADKENTTSMNLDGLAKGIQSSGADLDISLR